ALAPQASSSPATPSLRLWMTPSFRPLHHGRDSTPLPRRAASLLRLLHLVAAPAPTSLRHLSRRVRGGCSHALPSAHRAPGPAAVARFLSPLGDAAAVLRGRIRRELPTRRSQSFSPTAATWIQHVATPCNDIQ